jgi:hypothetical protein
VVVVDVEDVDDVVDIEVDVTVVVVAKDEVDKATEEVVVSCGELTQHAKKADMRTNTIKRVSDLPIDNHHRRI